MKRITKEATVRIAPVIAIPDLLRKLGADPAQVLAEAGVDLKVFDNPDNLISYEARGRLIGRCVARTGCRHFGLLLGQPVGLQSFGLVGLLVKYSPDVGTALRNLVRYFHLHVRGATPGLAVDGDYAVFSYSVYQPRVEATDQIGDAAVAIMLNLMRELCSPGWAPVEVRFAHRRPEDIEPYRRLLQAPLRFDAEEYGLVFSAFWLNRPVAGADADIDRMLKERVNALELTKFDNLPDRVRALLRTLLLTNQSGADRVAELLSMHNRTLGRRLEEFGTSFQELVDECRYEIARQLLEHSAMDVKQIADLLDYADASAFTRAFRRWSGTTPARWRAKR